jgi:hypothetical protein
MSRTEINSKIRQLTQELPEDLLKEVLDFMNFLKEKRLHLPSLKQEESDFRYGLEELAGQEQAHLEEEFFEYQKHFPREG